MIRQIEAWPAAVRGAAIALTVTVMSSGGAVAEPPGCFESAVMPVTVSEVLDGDTVLLDDGTVVRLAGVEAPKRPLTVDDDQPWPPAELATRGLRALIAGISLGLAPAGEAADRHGRIHGRLMTADGLWIEGEMAARGFVRARWLPGEEACFGPLVEAERGARQAAKGLWASPEYATVSADDPSLPSRNGLYELVEGRVKSVGRGSRMIFLDFGSDFRRDFTAMVPPEVAERLAAAGLEPEALAGRRVRVRGVIEESGGPAVRLNDPAELELID